MNKKFLSTAKIGTILFNFGVDLKYINNLLIIYICVVSKYLSIIICFIICFNFVKNFLANLIILYVRCVIFKFLYLFKKIKTDIPFQMLLSNFLSCFCVHLSYFYQQQHAMIYRCTF